MPMLRATVAAYSAAMSKPVIAQVVCPETAATTVFLVEDSAAVRERLLGLLRGVPGVDVIGHAQGAAEAIEKIILTRPGAVVLDLKLSDGNGLQVLRAIKQSRSATKVIILTNHASAEIRQLCLNAGADHFLDKTHEYHDLPRILRRIHCGQYQENASC